MPEWSKALATLADAEQFYRTLGCSHFHMDRDFPERYEEYIAFGVTRAIEETWMRADCETRLAELFQTTDASSTLWWQHRMVSEFMERLGAPDLLIRFEAVTRHLRTLVPDEDRVLVAETIIGRLLSDAPKGPIKLARSLHEFEVEAALVALVPVFLDGTTEIELARPLAERKADVISRLNSLTQSGEVGGGSAG